MDRKIRELINRSFALAPVAIAALLLAAPFAVSSIAAPPEEVQAQGIITGIVTTGRLNVRTGPSLGFAALTTVGQGELVELLGRTTDYAWLQIRTASGVVGWVGGAHIQIVYAGTGADLPVTSNYEPSAIVTAPMLNVRSGPGLSYPPITTVSENEGVGLLGRNHDATWVYVRIASGLFGWVSSGSLSTGYDLMRLPAVSTAGTVPSAPGAVPGAAPAAVPPSQPAIGMAFIITGQLTIHQGPDIYAEGLTVVGPGVPLGLIGRNSLGTWVYISTPNGIFGWVGAIHIQPNINIMSLPVVSYAGSMPSTPPPPAPIEPTYPADTTTLIVGQATLRSGPDIYYDGVSVVGPGVPLTLIGRNSLGTWVYVSLPNNITGWLGSMLISTNINIMSLPVVSYTGSVPSAPPSTVPGGQPPPSVQPGLAAGTARIMTGALNVRSGPGLHYEPITTVQMGELVTVLGRNSSGAWYKVQLGNGLVGWVSSGSDYIEFVVPPLEIPYVS